MCGIAGTVSFKRPVNASQVAAMTESLHHRGPDGGGLWTSDDGTAAFGHRRLSIIDLDDRAAQPMQLRNAGLTLTFNGEIYNYRDLRDELSAAGHIFRTESDTEVLLNAWHAWAEDCLERLTGMFAFAIWDQRSETLFLARDRMGEKPLYYHLKDGELTFASEVGAFHHAFDADLTPHMGALRKYLELGYILGEQSAYKGILRLPPAHCLRFSRHGVTKALYWSLLNTFGEKREHTSEAEAAAALSRRIDDAVASQMVSDVPLGAFLSGGIDSASVLASMTAQRTREGARPLAFTMDFEERSFSELAGARLNADHVGCDLNVGRPETDNRQGLTDTYLRAARAAGEPFGDTSLFPTFQLAEFTRRHVTVALSGDGGDELFAGYATYQANRLRRALQPIPPGLWLTLGRVAEHFPASFGKVGFDYKLKGFLAGLPMPEAGAHWSWRRLFSDEQARAVLSNDGREILNYPSSRDDFEHHAKEAEGLDPLARFLYVDMKTWLPDDILFKVDRMSMAHSLEVRAPFLDHNLVSFACGLPSELKLRGRDGKWILRQSQRQRIPSTTVNGAKRGFNAPVAHWFTGPLKGLLLDLVKGTKASRLFAPNAVEKLLNEHAHRRADHGFRLFALLGLCQWLETSRT